MQSWDTAAKAGELNDFCACTTWGLKDGQIFLLHVLRKQLEYPTLKRAVREQCQAFKASVVLIEDKSSGTQLLQELRHEGLYAITAYAPEGDKIMRMDAQTAMIETGFVHLPREAHWLDDYLHELAAFPKGKYRDQVNSTSQALHWFKQQSIGTGKGWVEFYKRGADRARGITAPVELVTMRAPGPYQNYYVSGTNGRAGRYSSNGDCIIENVHPEDVERLLKLGCTLVPRDAPGC